MDPYLVEMIRSGNQKLQRLAELNITLDTKPPILFIPDAETGLQGTGYWRVEAGVICYRRNKNGRWDEAITTYPEDEIIRLVQLLNQPPQKLT